MFRRRSISSRLLLPTFFTLALQTASSLLAQAPDDRDNVTSILQTIATDAAATPSIVYRKQGYLEAPNWTRDGSSLIFDAAGKIWTIPVRGGEPRVVPTATASHCNGSHGISPDGKSLAITCITPGLPEARVYIVPLAGGTPRVVTANPNSYFHSWSPDGKTIAFSRPNHGAINIVSIQVDGQNEIPVTTGTGISDDPDFSPDGRYIYFNSDRSGTMQIWRMHTDGTSPEQLTNDDLVNWTPHVSPDGKLLEFLSYEHGVTGHPSNKPITLRVMSLDDRHIRVLTHLTGGSGTMNVPAWAPDSHHVAFVGYQLPTTH